MSSSTPVNPLKKGDRVRAIGHKCREGTVVGYRTATGFVKVLWDGRRSPQRLSIYEVTRT